MDLITFFSYLHLNLTLLLHPLSFLLILFLLLLPVLYIFSYYFSSLIIFLSLTFFCFISPSLLFLLIPSYFTCIKISCYLFIISIILSASIIIVSMILDIHYTYSIILLLNLYYLCSSGSIPCYPITKSHIISIFVTVMTQPK